MKPGPGRSCPLHYRYRPGELAGADTLAADTAWVVGGLYGNIEALAAIVAAVEAERTAGLDAALVFNGDFHWFDADPDDFAAIQATVLGAHTLTGNIEIELARPDPQAGCGCAYPDFVDDATVEYSNRIIERLRETAREVPGATAALADLPRVLRVRIGDRVTGVIHGDPESLAGWDFSIERVTAAERPLAHDTVIGWARDTGVDAFACTHTCLPWAGCFGPVQVINNGSAGMPNFRGDPRPLVTRIAPADAAHPAALYAEQAGGTRWEAVAIDYDATAWMERFARTWPADSPARASYGKRFRDGPDHDLAQARPFAAVIPPSGG